MLLMAGACAGTGEREPQACVFEACHPPVRERQRERERDRQRETDRERDRETDRETDGET